MATSIIKRMAKETNITIQRATTSHYWAGNSDQSGAINLPGSPKLIIVEGYTPNTSWGTKLIVKQVDIANKKLYARLEGGTTQTYTIYCTGVYW